MEIKQLVGIVASALALYANAEAAPILSLDDCLRIALSESPTVRVADMEVQRMNYSRREVIGQFLPNIDFQGQYSRSIAKQTMYMDFDMSALGGLGGAMPGGGEGGEEALSRAKDSGKSDGGMKVGLDNSWTLGFNGSMPLISPQLWKALDISDVQILRSVEAAQQSRQTLVDQVKSAYYGLLLAMDSRKVMQESYDMAALTHDMYTKLYAAGAASDYDVLRTSVAMKNVEPDLMQADIAIKQTRLQLKLLMGVDAAFDFDITDRLSNYESTMYEDALTALSHDYSGNADLKLFDYDHTLAKKNLAVQKLAYAPTLALTANYSWTSMSNGNALRNFRWNPYSTVGLSLQVPVFSGLQRYNKVRQSSVQVAELDLQRQNLDRSIAMQVDVAIDNIKVNVKQIASCSESVGQADRAHTIMQRSFEIGAASYLDLRDSELALTRAQLAYYQAIYNYLVAGSQLELLQGTAPIDKYTNR